MNQQSKRLGDLMAGTIVIRTRSPRPPQPIPPVEFLAAVVAERRQRERTKLSRQQWVPAADELPAGWR